MGVELWIDVHSVNIFGWSILYLVRTQEQFLVLKTPKKRPTSLVTRKPRASLVNKMIMPVGENKEYTKAKEKRENISYLKSRQLERVKHRRRGRTRRPKRDELAWLTWARTGADASPAVLW